MTNAQIAADPRGVLDTTAEHRIPFWICEADYGMDLIVLSPYPQVIDFQLETPDGTRITPASGPGGANSQFVLSRYTSYYRCALPVLPADAGGSHDGLWYAVLRLGRTAPGQPTYGPVPQGYASYYNPQRAVLPYEFVAHTYSSLTFSAFATQASYDIGATVQLTALLREYDVPVQGRARVWAEIGRPDGATDLVALTEDPAGQHVASYELRVSGVFSLRVRARGETMRGATFEREQTLTAVAMPGGDRWSPNDPKNTELCELIDCLKGRGVLSSDFMGRLRELGIDFASLLECLSVSCRPAADKLETRRPTASPQVPIGQLSGPALDQLIEVLASRLGEKLRRPV